MKVMVFLPSYNDTEMAYQKSMKFLENKHVSKILIVDDSDDPNCIDLAKKIRHGRIKVVLRKRAGKWSAWKLALELARDYDGLIEVDSDVNIETLDPIILNLQSYDVVTAYPEIVPSDNYVGKSIIKVYRRMHEKLRHEGKFNMGGQVIALSRKAVLALLNHGFFNEPVIADDHVICLAACVLGLRHTSVDCGLRIRLPSTFSGWIRYRSRHRRAIKWAEHYVGLKTGNIDKAAAISRHDIKVTLKHFFRSLMKESNFIINLFIFLLLFLASFLPLESQVKWTKLR